MWNKVSRIGLGAVGVTGVCGFCYYQYDKYKYDQSQFENFIKNKRYDTLYRQWASNINDIYHLNAEIKTNGVWQKQLIEKLTSLQQELIEKLAPLQKILVKYQEEKDIYDKNLSDLVDNNKQIMNELESMRKYEKRYIKYKQQELWKNANKQLEKLNSKKLLAIITYDSDVYEEYKRNIEEVHRNLNTQLLNLNSEEHIDRILKKMKD